MAVVNYRSTDELAAHVESRDELLRFFLENPYQDIRVNNVKLPREIRVRIAYFLELSDDLAEFLGL